MSTTEIKSKEHQGKVSISIHMPLHTMCEENSMEMQIYSSISPLFSSLNDVRDKMIWVADPLSWKSMLAGVGSVRGVIDRPYFCFVFQFSLIFKLWKMPMESLNFTGIMVQICCFHTQFSNTEYWPSVWGDYHWSLSTVTIFIRMK